MSRKTCALALTVLTIALILIPSVHAEYPIDNVVVVQDLPDTMIAGNSYDMIITFDNVAQESVPLIVEITVTSEEPIGYDEIFIDEIELNGFDLMYEEVPPGVFTTVEGTVDADSNNELNIIIYTAINLMPGTYNFEIELYGEELPNKPPVADAGGPYYGERRESIKFDGTWSYDPDGAIVSYAWEFGDGSTGDGSTVSHAYDKTGTYTVTLTVTDDDGLTDSDITTAKVKRPTSPPPTPTPNKKPKADAGPNVKISVGSTMHFSGAGSYDKDGTIVSYRWRFDDGTTASGMKVSHSYPEPGHYTVTLTVKDNRGAEDSDKCEVFVWKPPAPVAEKFGDLVPGEQKGFKVNALDEANTIVTLDTTDDVTVTILKYEENPHPDDPLPAMAIPTYVDVEVSNPDAVLWPIYVEMHYTDEEVEGLDEASLGIYYWKDGAWKRCSDTGVETERNVVWAYMTAEEAAGSPILMGGIHAIPVPPLPPILSDLTVTPKEIEIGEEVTISCDIENIDSQSFTYIVTMQIGELTLVVDVELEPYESKIVTRNVTMNTAGDYDVEVDGLTDSFTVVEIPVIIEPVPKPAEFELSNLEVFPEEIEDGETITVSVDVTNVGEEIGGYTVELVLDGLLVDSQEIPPFGGGVTVTVLFKILGEVGAHEVEVDGMTDKFTVFTKPVAPPFWMQPGYIAVILTVIIAAAAIIYAYWKGMLPPPFPSARA